MHKILSLIAAGITLPSTAHAHGFGHQQVIDLTLPQHLYILSAATAIVLSFLLIALFLHSHQSILGTGRLHTNVACVSLIPIGRWVVVVLFVALVIIGWFGSQDPTKNIVPNIAWVMFNIGFVYFIMLIGNIWPDIHPLCLVPASKKSLSWQVAFGVWPAVALFWSYRWIENVSPWSSSPRALAVLLVVYVIVTLLGARRYGTKAWLQYGDPFGVFFRLIGLFAVTETRTSERKVSLRLPGAGLLPVRASHFSEVVFVMLMLGTIAFDGLKETEFWHGVLESIAFGGEVTLLTKTIGMVMVIGAMLLVYMLACLLSELFSGREGDTPLPYREYAFALLPIAVGYEIAHYLFFFLTESQMFFVLLSDPLGTGANIFGTARNTVVYDFFQPETLWRIQMVIIVLGHVLSVYIAHIIALAVYGSRGMALKSQLPMLALMIGYTVFSLWTITLPTVIEVQ